MSHPTPRTDDSRRRPRHPRLHPVPRSAAALVVTLAVAGAALGTGPSSPAVAAAPQAPAAVVALGGGAFGSTVSLSTAKLSSGKTSNLTMCTTRTDYAKTSNTAGVDLQSVGSIGAVKTSVRSSKSGSTRRPTVTSTTTSTTAGTRLLGGLVTASAIQSTAKASSTAGKVTLTGSTRLVGLRVAGLPVSATVAPNTKLTLPLGLGTVTLNRQTVAKVAGSTAIGVAAMTIDVAPGNLSGLPSGRIVIGRSTANAHTPTFYRPYGSAYGSTAAVGSLAKSGPTAYTSLPCGGSGGLSRTNKVAGIELPGVLKTGVVTAATRSTVAKTSATVASSSNVAGVRLLGGVVEVQAVKAGATATRARGKGVVSTSSTGIGGLKINGVARQLTVRENTTIKIAGVGTLSLRKAVRTSTGIEVHAIELRVDVARSGIPAGTVLVVGVARAGVAAR